MSSSVPAVFVLTSSSCNHCTSCFFEIAGAAFACKFHTELQLVLPVLDATQHGRGWIKLTQKVLPVDPNLISIKKVKKIIRGSSVATQAAVRWLPLNKDINWIRNKQNIRGEVQMIQVSKIEMSAVNLVQGHRITSPTIGWKFYRLTGLQNATSEIDVPDNTAPPYYVCIHSLYPNSMVVNRHQTCKEIKEDYPSCKLLEYNGTHRTELH